MPDDLLWAHLRDLPAFRALVRSIEARLLRELGPLPSPVLDVGCGDGHFAGVALGTAHAGVDLDLAKLAPLRMREVYALRTAASARELPFRDGAFGAAIANCALEHMHGLDEVLAEVARVLRPGGLFVFSVPNDRHNGNLIVGRALARLGARGTARRYREWFRRIQVHHHLLAPEEWQRRAERAGLAVLSRRDYLSPRATGMMELGHFTGAPRLLWHRLTGRWVPFPWRPRFFLTERLLAPRVAEEGVPGSSCSFFVAEKRAAASRTCDSPPGEG